MIIDDMARAEDFWASKMQQFTPLNTEMDQPRQEQNSCCSEEAKCPKNDIEYGIKSMSKAEMGALEQLADSIAHTEARVAAAGERMDELSKRMAALERKFMQLDSDCW